MFLYTRITEHFSNIEQQTKLFGASLGLINSIDVLEKKITTNKITHQYRNFVTFESDLDRHANINVRFSLSLSYKYFILFHFVIHFFRKLFSLRKSTIDSFTRVHCAHYSSIHSHQFQFLSYTFSSIV